MRSKLPLLLLIAALLAPGSARAALISANPDAVGLGTSVVDLTLDPMGVSTGAWLVVLNGTGLTIDSIMGVTPVDTDCSGLTSAASFDGQCASQPLGMAAIVAQITITATELGGTLSLVSGNITDFDTFDDVAFMPGVLLTVVPEPAALALAMLGLAGLTWSRLRTQRP